MPYSPEPEPELRAHQEAFLSALPRRVEVLEHGLVGLRARPDSETNREALRRRLEALVEAASLLRLATIETSLGDALIALEAPSLGPDDLDLLEQAVTTLRQAVGGSEASAPRAPSEPPAADPPPVLGAPRQASRRVLLVGSERLAETLRASVEAAGFDLLDTPSLDVALEITRTELVRLVVVDQRLPSFPSAMARLTKECPVVTFGSGLGARSGAQVSSASELVAQLVGPAPAEAPRVERAEPPPTDEAQASRRPGAERRAAIHGTLDALRGRRVLVADDDASVLWFVVSALRSAGAEVSEARDGLEAWELCTKRAPDLVVTDVMMPRLDGFALCRNLKRDVVLRDVPVVLLSWKEDLLQRARELDADADGYLPKDSSAQVIVARCSEVLAARAQLDARFSAKEIVHGRLDGVTPHFVLSLAGRTSVELIVEFCDAGFSYEAHFAGGQLVAARRRGADGVRSGENILAGLLGMRAGRFIVKQGALLEPQFRGDLETILAPHIARIRMACHLARGVELQPLEKLQLDDEVLGPYLASSPPVARKLIEQLRQGVSPARLKRSVTGGLLETVLLDLALRGAIAAAFDTEGKNLLNGEAVAPLPMDAELATPAPAPSRPALNPVPPSPALSEGGRAGDERVLFADSLRGSAARHHEVRAGALDSEPPGPPNAPTRAPVPGPLASRPNELELAEAVVRGFAWTPDEPPGVTPQRAPGSDRPMPRAELDRSVQGRAAAALPVAHPPEVERDEAVPRRGKAVEPVSGAAGVGAVHVSPPGPSRPPGKPQRSSDVEAASGLAAAAKGPLAAAAESLPELRASSQRVLVSAFSAAVKGWERAREHAHSTLGRSREWIAAARDEAVRRDLGVEAQPAGPAVPSPAASELEADATDPDWLPKVEPVARPEQGPVQRRSSGSALKRTVLPLTLVALGGFTAFSLVGALSSEEPGARVTRGDEAATAPSAVASMERSAAEMLAEAGQRAPGGAIGEESGGNNPELDTQLMALPPGVALGDNKGLLEVNTGDRHKIYVGAVFVGRGPARRIPLAGGEHEVRTRLGAEERVYKVRVEAGKRTRLEPTARTAVR